MYLDYCLFFLVTLPQQQIGKKSDKAYCVGICRIVVLWKQDQHHANMLMHVGVEYAESTICLPLL